MQSSQSARYLMTLKLWAHYFIHERSMFSMFWTHPVVNENVMISRNTSCHPWTNHIIDDRIRHQRISHAIYVHVIPSKHWTPHIINVLNTSYHPGTVKLSTDVSYLPWPNHIVDEHSISSRITSCHLRMIHFIYDHIMLLTNGSCH